MRRITLPTESYQHSSRPLNAERLLNVFLESEPADSRSDSVLLSGPGLSQFLNLPPGPILALNSDLPEHVYVVSGNHAWRVSRDPVTNVVLQFDLGYVGSAASNFVVTIAVGALNAVICVPPLAFSTTHGVNDPLSPMDFSTSSSTAGAASVAYLDGYFAFTSFAPSTTTFFITDLLALTFQALDFANADSFPNVLSRIISLNLDLWIFGEGGYEVWYDAGQADFSFRRRDGAASAIPTAHPRSIAKAVNAVGVGILFWLGADDVVYQSVGYQAQRVSNHAIERIIHDASGLGVGAGAFSVTAGFTYVQDGHVFYVLSFLNEATDNPLGGITIVYDATTKKWHDRSSDTNGVGRWRAQYAALYSDITLLGDYASGVIWQADQSIGTENGIPTLRQITLPPLWSGTRRAYCNRLEIEMEVGGDAPPTSMTLDYSDDGGFTWSQPRALSAVGALGRRQRVFATRLGSFRERMFRITGRGLMTVYGVDADISDPALLSGANS